jgi:plastocyanin
MIHQFFFKKIENSILLLSSLFSICAFAAPVEIQMKSLSYDPKNVDIVVGQSIVWKNVAYTEHSAASNDAKTFDTGMIAPGDHSKEITIKTPGVYSYHCSMHGRTMSGQITVKTSK